jgi:hypothetical protein
MDNSNKGPEPDSGGSVVLDRPEVPSTVEATTLPATSPPPQPANTQYGSTYQAPTYVQSQPQPQPQYLPQTRAAEPRQGRGPGMIVLLLVIGVSIVVVGLIIGALLFSTSGGFFGNNPVVGEMRVEQQAVPLGSATSADVNLDIGVGTLNVVGGAADLLNSKFTYNVEAWKPVIEQNTGVANAEVTVRQPSADVRATTNARNQWDILLNNTLPMTLIVTMGAGQGTLNLAGLDLTQLNVTTGVGQSTIDLSGAWKQDLTATIDNSVGTTNIVLPRDTGARVTVTGVVSNASADGFTRNGNVYTNAAYGNTDTTLDITVENAVGSIVLTQK